MPTNRRVAASPGAGQDAEGQNYGLPPIPGKRYFSIGEVSDLCAVKPHVLRYWEREFPQLRPVKRRGNRRYYQRHDVMVVRRIRELLYGQGFTIGGARRHMREAEPAGPTNPGQVLRDLRADLEDLLADLQR